MDVILLSDMRSLGKRGEVVHVKPGYARNYLLPQGIALKASVGSRRFFEQMRAKIDAQHEREKGAAMEIAAQLAEVRIKITKKVGETETLYGSVTATEVADRLAEKGFTVDRRRLDLEGGIKTVGDHQVRLELHSEVIAEILVTVVPEE